MRPGCLELQSASPSATTTESFTRTFDPERCRSFGPYYNCPQRAVLPNARFSLAEYDDSEDAFGKLNQYRRIAALPPLREDPILSDGATNHARYLVKNAEHLEVSGPYAHTEDPGNQWFTPEGLAAAQQGGDVIPPMREPLSAGQAINMWVSGPFHRSHFRNICRILQRRKNPRLPDPGTRSIKSCGTGSGFK